MTLKHDHFLFCTYVSSAGLLDAVTNLKSKFLCQNFRLTWDAPFSLDITGVDPDIWYRVDITEAGAPLSTFSITRVVNISEFNFTRNEYRDTSSSVIYEFQVTPINGAGDGRQSDLITGYFTGRELLWRNVNIERFAMCNNFHFNTKHYYPAHTITCAVNEGTLQISSACGTWYIGDFKCILLGQK